MDDPTVCPKCGAQRPAQSIGGLCPGCMLQQALDSDDLSLSHPGAPGATISLVPDTVLQKLIASVGPVPRVLLRDADAVDDTSPTVQSSSEMPASRPDRLQLFGEIARGGMGAVLKGRDPDLGRELALKILLEKHGNDPDLVRRFIEEAQIAGQLQHPGIVPVYELGAFADARPYFTMKLVKGRTLARMLADRPSSDSDLPRYLSIFEAIAQTVAYAHARGVIHRDLKPGNVMVGSFGEVQVMDWGLAKVLSGAVTDDDADKAALPQTVIGTARSLSGDPGLSHTGSVMGTPPYMSPEQAKGEIDRLDERADVFALGSILCELLTGDPAYTGRNSNAISVKAALGDTADAFDRLDASGADSDLIALAKDCMAREPDDRPRDAAAVASRVTGYLSGVQDRLRLAEIAQAAETARAEEAIHTAEAESARAEEANRATKAAEARAKAERKARKFQVGLAASILLACIIGGGSWMAFQLDRDRQRNESDRLVGTALATAQTLQSEAERAGPEAVEAWGRALDAADKAKGLLVARPPRAAIARNVAATYDAIAKSASGARELVKQIEADRQLVAELDEARLQEAAVKDNHFDPTPKLAAYATAFRKAGIDFEKQSVKEIATRLKPKRDVQRIAAAIEDWSWAESGYKKLSWDLYLVVMSIDPERNPLRAAIRKGDRAALRALARDPAVRRMPADSVWRLAQDLAAHGDRDDAIALLTAARSSYPADFWINQNLGYLLLDQKKSAETADAVRFLSVASALKPESPGVLSNLGIALDNQGKHDEAITAYREAIRIQPDYAGAHDNLGNSLQNQGKLDEAVAAFRQAIRLKPNDAGFYSNLGSALIDQGKLDEAAAACRQAIRIQPDYADAHVNLGIALNAQRKFDEAVAAYRTAIRIQPNHAKAHNNLGSALEDQGKLAQAIAAYREAIRIKPDYAGAYSNLSNSLHKQGKLDEAVATLREAIRLKPDFAVAYSNLGYALTDQGKLDEAIAACRQAIRLKPDFAMAHFNLGAALQAQGKLDQAINAYRQAIRLRPDYADAYNNLGNALRDQGKLDEAIAAYREAIRIQPDHDFAQGNLGTTLMDQGKLGEAIAACREAIRIRPDYAFAHCVLGLALRSDGRFTEALAELRTGHELGSKQRKWGHPSAQWVAECEALVKLESRFPALLRGDDSPKNNTERLALGQLCYDTKRFAASARFWSEALADDPKLGDDRKAGHRYNTACVATLAGAGQGKDDPKPDDAARAKLRDRARDWLRAELSVWEKVATTAEPGNKPLVAKTLAHWKVDADLAGVREEKELAKLPEEERAAWKALWREVDALLAKVKP